MIELPIWIFISSLIGAFGVGIGVGYKVQAPTISQDKTHCNTFAASDKTGWRGSMEMGRIYRNGKCVSVSCPFFTQKGCLCELVNSKCKLIS